MKKLKTMPVAGRAGTAKASGTRRDEWLALMTELGRTDRIAYREMRSAAWARIALRHGTKTPEEIADWVRESS